MELLHPYPPSDSRMKPFSECSHPATLRNGFNRESIPVSSQTQSPEIIGDDEYEIFIAVGKSYAKAITVLRWAFRCFPGRKFCILHVHQPSSLIPTLLGKLPASEANHEVVSAYRMKEKDETNRLLLNYLSVCCHSKIEARILTIEAAQVQKGILDLVNEHGIRKLVIGAMPDRIWRDQLRMLQHEKIVAELESGEILTGRGKNQETNLRRPVDTRWGSHYLTLFRLCLMWSSVQEVLINVVKDASSSTNRGTANGLLKKMDDYEFVFMLHLMKNLLGITNELSLCLERGDQNIVQAMSLIASSKNQLQEFRENGWHDILDQVNSFCQLHSISILDMNEHMIIDSNGRRRGKGELITNLHHYRVEIFYQVVDLIMQEMNSRFSEVNTELLGCISCLHPRNSFSQFDIRKLIHLAKFYPEDFTGNDYLFLEQQLRAYLFNLRDDPQFSSIEDLGILAQKLIATEKHIVFPLVYRLIELALVLPVATASVERVFSAMKTVKNDLRNRMGDEWMNDSLVVYVEKNIFSKIENEPILQYFQQMESRRINLSSFVPTNGQE